MAEIVRGTAVVLQQQQRQKPSKEPPQQQPLADGIASAQGSVQTLLRLNAELYNGLGEGSLSSMTPEQLEHSLRQYLGHLDDLDRKADALRGLRVPQAVLEHLDAQGSTLGPWIRELPRQTAAAEDELTRTAMPLSALSAGLRRVGWASGRAPQQRGAAASPAASQVPAPAAAAASSAKVAEAAAGAAGVKLAAGGSVPTPFEVSRPPVEPAPQPLQQAPQLLQHQQQQAARNEEPHGFVAPPAGQQAQRLLPGGAWDAEVVEASRTGRNPDDGEAFRKGASRRKRCRITTDAAEY